MSFRLSGGRCVWRGFAMGPGRKGRCHVSGSPRPACAHLACKRFCFVNADIGLNNESDKVVRDTSNRFTGIPPVKWNADLVYSLTANLQWPEAVCDHGTRFNLATRRG